jgi:hypothetical protein
LPSDSFSSNRDAKDASLEQTNFMTQKPKLFKTQEYVNTNYYQAKLVKDWDLAGNSLQS